MTIGKDSVAILLAAYNGEKYIAEQIGSILRQSHTDWTLFIRDDGSSDGTPRIIEELRDVHPDRIAVVPSGPASRPLGAAGNFAALQEYVSGRYDFPYYMFADQDDVWKEDKIRISLERMRAAEREKDGPVLVHTDLTVTDAALKPVSDSYFRYRSLRTDLTDLRHLLAENNATGCTMLWNRALNGILKDTLKDPAILMHDWWVTLTAAAFGRIVAIPESTVLYRQHASNTLGASKVNSIGFIRVRLRSPQRVKSSLTGSMFQAGAFLERFGGSLSAKDYETVAKWASLPGKNKLARQAAAIRGGYFKQGAVQIIGELLFI